MSARVESARKGEGTNVSEDDPVRAVDVERLCF